MVKLRLSCKAKPMQGVEKKAEPSTSSLEESDDLTLIVMPSAGQPGIIGAYWKSPIEALRYLCPTYRSLQMKSGPC